MGGISAQLDTESITSSPLSYDGSFLVTKCAKLTVNGISASLEISGNIPSWPQSIQMPNV